MNKTIRVQFTENGLDRLARVTEGRPPYEKEEGADNILLFTCSEEAAADYFFGFGADGVVLSPLTVTVEIESRLRTAYDAYLHLPDKAPPKEGEEESIAFYRAAVGIAVCNERASSSLLQRKLQIGYGRAARLIDRMLADGFIEHSKDRRGIYNVLLTEREYIVWSTQE